MSGRLTYLSLLAACSVTPLTNQIQVGQEPFVIAVGEGPDSLTDLFAAPAGGGSFVRLTFTRAEERIPRLSPSGTSVAFLRRSDPAAERWSLVVLDLLTNREESAPLPQGAGKPQAIGWSPDGQRVVVKTFGYLASPAPPRSLWLSVVGLDSTAWADTVTAEMLGEPKAAKIEACRPPETGFCVVASGGEFTKLEAGTVEPIRWGPDSMAYLRGGNLEIRPLSGGRARQPIWSSAPSRARQFTYHPGGGTDLRSPS